jgi:hypothetical protein
MGFGSEGKGQSLFPDESVLTILASWFNLVKVQF